MLQSNLHQLTQSQLASIVVKPLLWARLPLLKVLLGMFIVMNPHDHAFKWIQVKLAQSERGVCVPLGVY
jgi:hypothetical protein